MFIRIFFLFWLLLSGSVINNAQDIKNCKTCSTTLLKPQNIDTLSVDELRLLTNEIYARKGYTFTNDLYRNYFENFDWYKPLNDNGKVKLSTIEEQNVKLLKDHQKVREDERLTILTYFRGLQQLAVNNNDTELKRVFPKREHPEELSIDELKMVLKHIDFDDVHWFKNNALHRIEVDNGYVKIVYSFSITSGYIMLKYNYMSSSDIMEGFDSVFSDYMSESEYAIWWTFKLQNGKVVFDSVDAAG